MAVNSNMFEASVSAEPPHRMMRRQGASIMTLPLNLIARIVSYVQYSLINQLSRN